VWLRGFGIASRVSRERRSPEPPEVIAGTRAYMAPEQTGYHRVLDLGVRGAAEASAGYISHRNV